MASPMTLHALVGCPNCLTAILTVKACNLNIKVKYYTSSEQAASMGPLPALETEEGRISQKEAVLRYVSGLKAYLGVAGQSAFDKAQVDLWMDMVKSELPSANSIRAMTQGRGEWTQEGLDAARKSFVGALARFEEHLALRTYFVGNSVTLADIAFTAVLAMNRSNIMSSDLIKALPNVNRHFQFMTNTSFFQAVMGRSFAPMTKEMPMADSALTKAHAMTEVTAGPAKGGNKPAAKGKGEGKKAAPAPKKKEVAPPAPAKVEKPELTEEEKAEQAADTAAGNWFFEYKTEFVNATDRSAAIDKLVTEWDAKRFSMWFTKYDKLDNECNNLIRTNNMLNFFYRGLDGLNKHTLAAFGAYGPEDNHNLMGCWMFKGTEAHQILKESNQGEYFTYTRLDMSKPEDVNRVKSFWLNVDMENPKPVEDGAMPLVPRLFK